MTSPMQWAAILDAEEPVAEAVQQQEPTPEPVRAPRPRRKPRTRRAVTLTLVPEQAPEPPPVDEVCTAEGEVFPVVPVPDAGPAATAWTSDQPATDAAVLVVPARDSDRWTQRMVLYAGKHGIAVGAVIVVHDDRAASADLRTVLASGQASRVLVAVADHLPREFVVVAAGRDRDLPAAQRRPTPIDRTRMEQAKAPWELADKEPAVALPSPAQRRRAER